MRNQLNRNIIAVVFQAHFCLIYLRKPFEVVFLLYITL